MPSGEAPPRTLVHGPTGWFQLLGFERGGDRLVFERCVPYDTKRMRALIGPDAEDDPGIVHCYPIEGTDASALAGCAVPEADWFVNACQPPDADP
jgi:hypothetical protein